MDRISISKSVNTLLLKAIYSKTNCPARQLTRSSSNPMLPLTRHYLKHSAQPEIPNKPLLTLPVGLRLHSAFPTTDLLSTLLPGVEPFSRVLSLSFTP